jgi:hypothetical protein
MPAQLERPVLPPYLYRYRRINDEVISQEVRAIHETYLWCSTYKAMNDPMEGFFEPTRRFLKDNNYNRASRNIFDQKIQIGICCFSDTYDNELMWSHYAENYSGICIGYAPNELLNGLPANTHLLRVAYGSKPPDITDKDAESPYKAAIKVLSHKKASWIYEREWRLLGPIGRVHVCGRAVLREVRIGANIDAGHRHTLLDELNGKPIRVYEMEPVSAYEHKWKQLHDAKGNPIKVS